MASFVAIDVVVLRSFDVEATHVRRCDLRRRRGETTTDETCTWKTRKGGVDRRVSDPKDGSKQGVDTQLELATSDANERDDRIAWKKKGKDVVERRRSERNVCWEQA